MSDEENRALVRRMIEDVLNANRPDMVAEVFATDFRAGGAVLGLGALSRAVVHHHVEYSGYHLAIDEMIAGGDAVVVRGVVRGTHAAEVTVGGIWVPPTGKPVEFRVFALFRIADGRIAEEIATGDDLGLLQQLGYVVVPATPAAVSR